MEDSAFRRDDLLLKNVGPFCLHVFFGCRVSIHQFAKDGFSATAT